MVWAVMRVVSMKGQLQNLGAGAMAVVVLVIVIAVGSQILGQVKATQTANTTEYNLTTSGLSAMNSFSNWFVIIVLVIIAVVIISLLVRGLGGISGGD